MKFKSYGVHFIEWLNRSKFEKDESNHKIVTQFYNDHAATFPKLFFSQNPCVTPALLVMVMLRKRAKMMAATVVGPNAV